jgi:hypothetical protein
VARPQRWPLTDGERAMDSWATTLRLMLVTAVIAAFYVLGRWVAEALQALAVSGSLPSL